MRKTVKIFFIIFIFLKTNIVLAEEFNITSTSVIMYNLNDNEVLYELNSEEEVQIASLTKIMTTITAIELLEDSGNADDNKSIDDEVTITSEALEGLTGYSKVGFEVGEVVTYRDLLYGVMLPSGADAANALAIGLTGSVSSFVELMNEKADELNLKHTHFDNPYGMDSDENYSTASDIASLLIYALQNETFKTVFSALEYTIESSNLTIKSTLVGYSRYGLDISNITGSKSGFTDIAGRCLASTATIDDVNYLLVTLGADIDDITNALRDSLTIYNYYSSNYSYQTIIKEGQVIETIPLKWGKTDSYDITASDDISLFVINNIYKQNIEYVYEGVTELTYKIKKGDKLGTVTVKYDDTILTTFDVYLDSNLKYYHPILYAVIAISSIIMIISLAAMIRTRRKKFYHPKKYKKRK